MDGFQPTSLFAVQGVIGLTMRDVTTRATPAKTSSLVLSSHRFALLVAAGALMLWISGGVAVTNRQWFAYSSAKRGITSYYALTLSMRLGDVAAVTPFRYVRLVSTLIISITLFQKEPDLQTLTGAAIIFLSGFYTFFRERQLSRQTPY